MIFLPTDIWNLILFNCVTEANSNIEESIWTLAQLRRTCKTFKNIIDSDTFRFLYIVRVGHSVQYSPPPLTELFGSNRHDSFNAKLGFAADHRNDDIGCYHIHIANKKKNQIKDQKCIEKHVIRKEVGIHKLFCREPRLKMSHSPPYCCKKCPFGLSYPKAAALAKYAIKSAIVKKEKNKKKKNGLVK